MFYFLLILSGPTVATVLVDLQSVACYFFAVGDGAVAEFTRRYTNRLEPLFLLFFPLVVSTCCVKVELYEYYVCCFVFVFALLCNCSSVRGGNFALLRSPFSVSSSFVLRWCLAVRYENLTRKFRSRTINNIDVRRKHAYAWRLFCLFF